MNGPAEWANILRMSRGTMCMHALVASARSSWAGAVSMTGLARKRRAPKIKDSSFQTKKGRGGRGGEDCRACTAK